jgi:F0F1-type ATP synthase assembly protein I
MALKDRYSAKPMGAAYQGAMEAVLSIVIAVLLGWWADRSFETSPWGVLAGATIGFAAFVLRLSRLGAAMNAPPEDPASPGGDAHDTEPDQGDDPAR